MSRFRLDKTLEEDRAEWKRREHGFKCDIMALTDELREAKEQVAFLQQYKTGYDDLQAGAISKFFNKQPTYS